MKKMISEMTTVEEKRAALKCGHLCVSAARKYGKGDESWNVDFKELVTILHSQLGYSENPFTIEELYEAEKEVVSQVGMIICLVAEKTSKN